MKRRGTRAPFPPPSTRICLPRGELDTFMEYWLSLSPAERLRRSWEMRKRLRDPEAGHDAKLFPKP